MYIIRRRRRLACIVRTLNHIGRPVSTYIRIMCTLYSTHGVYDGNVLGRRILNYK